MHPKCNRMKPEGVDCTGARQVLFQMLLSACERTPTEPNAVGCNPIVPDGRSPHRQNKQRTLRIQECRRYQICVENAGRPIPAVCILKKETVSKFALLCTEEIQMHRMGCTPNAPNGGGWGGAATNGGSAYLQKCRSNFVAYKRPRPRLSLGRDQSMTKLFFCFFFSYLEQYETDFNAVFGDRPPKNIVSHKTT